MNVIASPMANVLIMAPKVFGGERGFFGGSLLGGSHYHARFEAALGRPASLVQDRHPRQKKAMDAQSVVFKQAEVFA